jgi:hypothetical protein
MAETVTCQDSGHATITLFRHMLLYLATLRPRPPPPTTPKISTLPPPPQSHPLSSTVAQPSLHGRSITHRKMAEHLPSNSNPRSLCGLHHRPVPIEALHHAARTVVVSQGWDVSAMFRRGQRRHNAATRVDYMALTRAPCMDYVCLQKDSECPLLTRTCS